MTNSNLSNISTRIGSFFTSFRFLSLLYLFPREAVGIRVVPWCFFSRVLFQLGDEPRRCPDREPKPSRQPDLSLFQYADAPFALVGKERSAKRFSDEAAYARKHGCVKCRGAYGAPQLFRRKSPIKRRHDFRLCAGDPKRPERALIRILSVTEHERAVERVFQLDVSDVEPTDYRRDKPVTAAVQHEMAENAAQIRERVGREFLSAKNGRAERKETKSRVGMNFPPERGHDVRKGRAVKKEKIRPDQTESEQSVLRADPFGKRGRKQG